MAKAAQLDPGPFDPERLEVWAYWITERESIRRKKELGKRPPWTQDVAMATTRFCNVRRMDDKVSRWMLENWYRPQSEVYPREALLAAMVARHFNKIETLTYITKGKPFGKWDREVVQRRVETLAATGEPVFGGAYILNGNGRPGQKKIDFVCENIDSAAKKIGSDTQARAFVNGDSMRETAMRIDGVRGIGSFMAGQIVADLRWLVHKDRWLDRMSWAPPGPGSSRGMRYLLGEPIDCVHGRGADLKERPFVQYLGELISIAKVHPQVGPIFKERKLEAHDIQNTLCELSKLARIRDGGRGKNQYAASLASILD